MPTERAASPSLPTLTIYFDGLCPLCSREIEHYRRLNTGGVLAFVDITAPDFDARRAGLDPLAVRRHLHAQDAAGRVFVGVDSFLEVWRRLPRYAWLHRLARRPAVHAILRFLYAGFARVRPWLPRRKALCQADACAQKSGVSW